MQANATRSAVFIDRNLSSTDCKDSKEAQGGLWSLRVEVPKMEVLKVI